MKPTATIILNRNLAAPTEKLYEHLEKYDKSDTDVYVLEAGSDKDKLSKYYTWHADSKEIMKHGLRYPRGMNYALLNLWKEKKWKHYDSFFLIRPPSNKVKLLSLNISSIFIGSEFK